MAIKVPIPVPGAYLRVLSAVPLGDGGIRITYMLYENEETRKRGEKPILPTATIIVRDHRNRAYATELMADATSPKSNIIAAAYRHLRRTCPSWDRGEDV
jgi:hypothetical protein